MLHIVCIDSRKAWGDRLQAQLPNASHALIRPADRQALITALSKEPHLVLVHAAADESLPWSTWLRESQDLLDPHNIPVLGYSTMEDPVARLVGRNQGLDNVIAQSALESSPAYQIERHARPGDFASIRGPLPAGVLEGINLFNQKRFHPAHDAIEPIWLKEKRGIRLLYQGILQIGIAFYLVEKNQYRAARKTFACSLAKLKIFRPHCAGVDIGELYHRATACEREVIRLGAERLSTFDAALFPQIRLA